MTTQFHNIASRKYITETAILTSVTNRGKFVHLGEIDKRRVSDLEAQAANLGNEFQITFVLTQRTRAAVGMKYSYRGDVFLSCKSPIAKTKVTKKTKRAAKKLKTKNAEIINFFLSNHFEYYDENDDQHQVQSVEDCRNALRREIEYAVGDDKWITRSYYGALYRPADCSGANFGESITLLHRGAKLLGTTVLAVLKEISPEQFGRVSSESSAF